MKSAILALAIIGSLAGTIRAEASCTPTGFYRDGIEMTAALINPPRVTGTVDATGCHVAVYYGGYSEGVIEGADLSGATYFGVLANGDGGPITVSIRRSRIHGIGEVPHNGTQHGIGIYLRGFFNPITATIRESRIWDYQKGGIVANGAFTTASVRENRVQGDGHVTFIAQNGIQVGYGAHATVTENYVAGNSFIGYPGDGSASGGIIVVGGPGYGMCPEGAACQYTTETKIRENTVVNNDVGIYLSNWGLAGPATMPTQILVEENVASDDLCFNTSYQAGISDVGNTDTIVGNRVFGPGYTAPCGFNIDADPSYAVNAIVKGNKTTPTASERHEARER